MGHSSDRGDLNCGNLALEVSVEKNFSVFPIDNSWEILFRNVAAFCPCPKSLPVVWEVLLSMCCVYWLVNKDASASGSKNRARQEFQADRGGESRQSQGDAM